MFGGLVALAHVFGYNLVGNTIAHGALSLSILKGFGISLFQCAVAHPGTVGALAAAIGLMKGQNDPEIIEIKIQNPENDTFEGIINYLQKEGKKDQIEISSSSIYSNNYHPNNTILFNIVNKNFWSQNLQNSWICFDFKEQIIPTDYIIQSVNYKENYYHLKNWVIEGSNDQTSWEILDKQENNSFLNGKRFIHTFKITNNNDNKKFKFIRLRQTGPNWKGNDYLGLESIDFFGSLFR